MSAAPYVPLLVLVALTHARFISTQPEFEIPEVDGSAVDDTCRIFYGASPDPDPAHVAVITTATTMIAATATPVTRKKVVTTQIRAPTEKPAPIRPAAAQPITNSHSNSAARLLHYLLTNSRGRTGARFNSVLSQPIRGPRNGGWRASSSSEEDSSDES